MYRNASKRVAASRTNLVLRASVSGVPVATPRLADVDRAPPTRSRPARALRPRRRRVRQRRVRRARRAEPRARLRPRARERRRRRAVLRRPGRRRLARARRRLRRRAVRVQRHRAAIDARRARRARTRRRLRLRRRALRGRDEARGTRDGVQGSRRRGVLRGKSAREVSRGGGLGRARARGREVGAREGVETLGVDAFVEKYCEGEGREIARDALEAARAASEASAEAARRCAGAGTPHDAHWSEGEILEGAAAGTVVVGALRVTRSGATCEGFVEGVLLPSRRAMNRAIHGDRVAVEICPEDEWRAATATSVDARRRRRDDDDDDVKGSHGTSRGRHSPRRAGRRGVFGRRGRGRVEARSSR